jgi:hypothetical protein
LIFYVTHKFRRKITKNIWNMQDFMQENQIYLYFLQEKLAIRTTCDGISGGMPWQAESEITKK